ncbi:hypothetical protein XI25_04795 [Paenibacillus sp. DMB20]|nr:hypothetical protein XI25_04795 [Paenibacillus sp. DMB20]
MYIHEHIKKPFPFGKLKKNRIPAQNDSIDYIFILAVLHHIDDEQIRGYLLEFERILKPGGKVIVMEPYLCDRRKWNNRFMNWYDDGEYIRNEKSYLDLFQSAQYECQVLKKFTKCFLYNEIFFSATKKGTAFDHFTHETIANSLKGGDIGDSCVPS